MNSILLKSFILITAFAGIILYRRQNSQPRLGGPICKAKAFWLYYTIINWFFILPYSLFYISEIPLGHYYVWITLASSMWIRGIAELYMLFVTKNWTPVIGISHDIFTISLMILAPFFAPNFFTNVPINILIYTISLYVSMMAETYYALSFYNIMKGRTGGEEGLWYAHEDDPRFKKIIFITTIFNYFLYLALIVFFWFNLN